MSIQFKKGETLYTHTGNPVEYDHAHGDVGYVRPILTVVRQATTYSGDDFHEEEDEVAAEHLISVPLDKLYRSKPVAVLDSEIAEKREALASLQKTITLTERDCKAAIAVCDSQLTAKHKELQSFRDRYPLFEETMRFLEGEPMFPLAVSESHYTHAPNIPVIPKLEDLRYIRLRPVQKPYGTVRKAKTEADKLEWVAVTKGPHGDDRETLQLFFATDAERADHIAGMFAKVCDKFRAKPDYGSVSYTSSIDYGVLLRWIDAYPALSMPQDLIDGKTAADAAFVEARRAHLQKQLEAIGGAT